MSDRDQDSGASGCALFILVALAAAIAAWAIKIALIVIGIAMLIGAVFGGIGLLLFFWFGAYNRSAAQASVDEFTDALDLLTIESDRRLSTAITAWDDLQRNRGVGTALEQAFFAESVDPATRELLDEVNFYVEYGEELLAPIGPFVDQDERIDRIRERDETTVQLESLRRQVS